MSEVTAIVTRSMDEAASASARLIEHCIDHAVAELQAAELQSQKSEQRKELGGAWRGLQLHRKEWSERFPRLLGAAFRAAGDGSGPTAPSLRPSSLSLVDEGEIARNIESSRLTQQLTAMLDRPLAELDALMSSALGLPGVQPERNPLRPEVYAQALRKMVDEARPEPGWPALWLRHMTQPLATELEQLYRDQAHLLTLARVQAANYRMRSIPSPHGGPRASPSGHAPLGPASGHAPLASSSSDFAALGPASGPGPTSSFAPLSGPAPLRPANGDMPRGAADSQPAPLQPQAMGRPQLHQFLVRGTPQAHQQPEPSYYAQIEEELSALEAAQEVEDYDAEAARQYAHLPPVARPQRRIATDSPLPPQLWGNYGAARQRSLVRARLKKEARELGQVYGLEAVRELVDEVARDPRLLAPVREAIVGLEPSLLRLAMVAPRFFSDEAHPGRLLVERVAERSFKFNDEFSVEFQGFLHPVVQAFNRLNHAEGLEDAAPFQQALASLQAGWAAQDTLDGEEQQKVLEAVQFAERRKHEADRIAGELAQRSDLAAAPPAVRDFLLGPWAVVVAQSRLQAGAPGLDPGGYLGVVGELLWSIDRNQALHEPARAFEVIPRVLGKLRTGLNLLGHDTAATDAFFQQLEQLHRPVMKLRARQRHREMPAAERIAIADPSAPAADDNAAERLWLAPDELRAAGFEDTVPSGLGALAEAKAASAPAPLDSYDAETLVANLAVGSWVDLLSKQHWRRARVVWTSANNSFFMFVSHGGQPHSMTRRTLQRLVREQMLRPVAGDGVVPRALETLARQPAAAA